MEISKWIGLGVSVNCGEPLGCYQGTIHSISKEDGKTITLIKAFRNGYPYPKSRVTLSVADIKDLKIIELGSGENNQSRSTVAVRSKKAVRNTVCENLQANHAATHSPEPRPTDDSGAALVAPTPTTNPPQSAILPRTNPIDIQQPRHNKNNASGSGGSRSRRKNDQLLATADVNDPAMQHDFDFQTNLALFRKLPAPDLLRAVPEPAPKQPQYLYTAEEHPDVTYVTDDGVLVPTVSHETRRRIRGALKLMGTYDSVVILLARAAADLALKMLGGARRLATGPTPHVLAIAGPYWPGVVVVHAARLLMSSGVIVGLKRGRHEDTDDLVAYEQAVNLYIYAGGAEYTRSLAPDLVLMGVNEPVPKWCGRCQILHVEGEGEGRASVWALPVPRGGEGRMHAAHTAIPEPILRGQGISDIRSCALLLALHRTEDEVIYISVNKAL